MKAICDGKREENARFTIKLDLPQLDGQESLICASLLFGFSSTSEFVRQYAKKIAANRVAEK